MREKKYARKLVHVKIFPHKNFTKKRYGIIFYVGKFCAEELFLSSSWCQKQQESLKYQTKIENPQHTDWFVVMKFWPHEK